MYLRNFWIQRMAPRTHPSVDSTDGGLIDPQKTVIVGDHSKATVVCDTVRDTVLVPGRTSDVTRGKRYHVRRRRSPSHNQPTRLKRRKYLPGNDRPPADNEVFPCVVMCLNTVISRKWLMKLKLATNVLRGQGLIFHDVDHWDAFRPCK